MTLRTGSGTPLPLAIGVGDASIFIQATESVTLVERIKTSTLISGHRMVQRLGRAFTSTTWALVRFECDAVGPTDALPSLTRSGG
jgi:hypothetical protein